MQMRPGNAARGTDRAQNFALFYRLTVSNVNARHMHVGADQPLAVIDKNGIAIEEIITRIGYHTIGRSLDRRPATNRHIKPGMRVARQTIEDAAQAEAG